MRFLRKIRRVETLFASALFVVVFFFFLKTYDKSILEIQLSYWGAFSKTPWLWNALIVFLSVSIFNNAMLYVESRKDHKYRMLLMLGFLVLCINLFITGAVTMHYQIHTICAVVYFFTFPAVLLLLSLDRKALSFRERSIHFIFCLAMFFVPISVAKVFPGMGVAESAHSFLAIAWNVWILPKR